MGQTERAGPTRRAALGGATAMMVTRGLIAAPAAAEGSTAPKRAVTRIENAWITTRDGTRLACRLWVPAGAADRPVGVVLEATPYSKRDGTRPADTAWADQFCPHGFAYARIDLRGSGESDGLLEDEYLAREQQDIVDAIVFLARQHWCNGAVGMRGYSWGGIAALQVAALAPPALKAIVTACSTDRRYTTDAHYAGGTPASVGLLWGTIFKNVLADAPDPAIVGPGWRQQWLARLQAAPAIIGRWAGHMVDDAYWRHGSVAADYSRITCGVFAVGGQSDAYTDTVLRLLDGLDAPRKGLIGPWSHGFPDAANPGPGLDWVVEEVRWWGHWLHGEDTGIMREPMLRAYVNDCTPAEVWPHDVPGRWMAEQHWPSSGINHVGWFLNDDGLRPDAGQPVDRHVAPHQTLGLTKREWIPLDPALDLPGDQARDDALSLAFDGPPIDNDVEIFGAAVLSLRVAADRPVAKVVVRLNEVHPDGTSRSVSYGVLNLTHRASDADPVPLEPGTAYDVTVPLRYAAHRFRRGNRIRVALSESLWPMLLPSPEPVTLTVTTGVSRIVLPVRTAGSNDAPATMPPLLRGRNAAGTPQTLQVDGPDREGRVRIVKELPPTWSSLDDIATQRLSQSRIEMSIRDDDPTSSVWRIHVGAGSKRSDWSFRTVCSGEVRASRHDLFVTETVQAFEGDHKIFNRTLETRITRRLA